MSKKIAIIGSGVSGLAAIKSCLNEGLTPVCFESTDHAGGLWHYSDTPIEGQSCVMRSTVINTSKEVMTYSDFPIPGEFPVFMHNRKVLEYLRMYGESFNAAKYTRFNTEVLKVRQTAEFEKTGQWELEILDRKTKNKTKEVFDGVMVCTGHHAEKNIPKFEGMEEFRGQIVHSHDYRHPEGYQNKRVVVVGIGNSGSDLLVEFSRISKQVFLSTRRGCWIFKRVGPGGLPNDLFLKRRVRGYLFSYLPRWLRNYLGERQLNKQFDHRLYGLEPKHRMDATHPTGGDDLPNIFISGTVVVRPDIRRFTETGVEFVDGSREEVDVIFLATGYKFGFPFVDHPALEVTNNQIGLYKYMFPPDLRLPTLAVLGYIQPLGAIMPIVEMQARWATRVFKGLAKLPSEEEMWADVERKRAALRERYVDSQRHTVQIEYTPYMDEIARLVGCMPDIGKTLLRDPRLGLQLIFGPAVPYQYRLEGPGRWEGAREALFTVWDRTIAGISKGQAPRRPAPVMLYVLVVVIVAVLFKLFLF